MKLKQKSQYYTTELMEYDECALLNSLTNIIISINIYTSVEFWVVRYFHSIPRTNGIKKKRN